MEYQMRDFYPFPKIKAFTSRKKARKYMKKRFGKGFKILDSQGQCIRWDSDATGGEPVCVVILDMKDVLPHRRFALLAHECVHVVEAWLDNMGVEEPDGEQVAYGVQCAMLACIDQIGADKFFKQPEKE